MSSNVYPQSDDKKWNKTPSHKSVCMFDPHIRLLNLHLVDSHKMKICLIFLSETHLQSADASLTSLLEHNGQSTGNNDENLHGHDFVNEDKPVHGQSDSLELSLDVSVPSPGQQSPLLPQFSVPSEFFILIGRSNVHLSSLLFRCQICGQIVSCNNTNRGNLRRHVELSHEGSLSAFDAWCKSLERKKQRAVRSENNITKAPGLSKEQSKGKVCYAEYIIELFFEIALIVTQLVQKHQNLFMNPAAYITVTVFLQCFWHWGILSQLLHVRIAVSTRL